MSALFACTRCNGRYPFEDLSQEQQLCKDCRGAFPVVKCTYCRTEFQQENNIKGSTATICKKCDQNVKLYGKPAACEYCNIIAAFIGTKCQRCTNSEKKYGPPLTCEQCKQRCAFDRKDDSRKKVDGKLLCWLCTLSYKRALAKAKQNNPTRHSSSSSSSSSSLHKGSGHHRSTSQNHKHSLSHTSSHKATEHTSPSKKPRLELNKSTNGSLPSSQPSNIPDAFTNDSCRRPYPNFFNKSSNSDSTFLDPNSSDHVVAMTQLKDQIASLQKQQTMKDQQLLSKDKQVAELKATNSKLERELRGKIQTIQKQHGELVQELQSKLRQLQKQVITLTKANKKGNTESPLT